MEERGYLLLKNGEKVYFPEGIAILSGGKYSSYKDDTVEIHLPDSVAVIANSAFYGWSNLQRVTCHDVEISNLYHIGTDAFRDCEALKEFMFPVGLRTIDKNAFVATDFTILDFSNTALEFLGDHAFFSCKNLIKVSLSGQEVIPKGCFGCCDKLLSVSGSWIHYVGHGAFAGCKSLLQIPNVSKHAAIDEDNKPFVDLM